MNAKNLINVPGVHHPLSPLYYIILYCMETCKLLHYYCCSVKAEMFSCLWLVCLNIIQLLSITVSNNFNNLLTTWYHISLQWLCKFSLKLWFIFYSRNMNWKLIPAVKLHTYNSRLFKTECSQDFLGWSAFWSRSMNIISSSLICNMYNCATFCCSLAVSTNADDFSDELDFNIVYQFNITN